MNFRLPPATSVVLMSRRPGAPYEDSLSGDGSQLIYEGHDQNRVVGVDPKSLDQPWRLPSGRPTENAKFANAISSGEPLVRVYEKLRDGIWSDRGLFQLLRYSYERKESQGRMVFKFVMALSRTEEEAHAFALDSDFRRIIPSWVKQEVFKRDKGKCVMCGATDQLHFDHDLPFAKGGTGLLPANVRILCARHNLQKGASIL